MLMDMSFGVILIAIPLLAIKLGAPVLILGLLGASRRLTYVVSCPGFGKLSDQHGQKRFLLSSCVLLSFFYLTISVFPQLYYLFIVCLLRGIVIAMFWPPLLSSVGRTAGRDTLMRNLTTFNISWSAGAMLGAVLGGFLFEIHFRLPFYFASLIGITIALLLYKHPVVEFKSSQQADMTTDVHRDVRRQQGFLCAAWMANFISFIIGILYNIFPKLAVELQIPPRLIGSLLFLVGLSQATMFLLIGRTDKWHYRLGPLVLSQLAASIGLLLILRSNSPLIFALAFIFIGITVGMTYYSSVFYGLHGYRDKGRKSGFHESVLVGGALFGSLIGGIVAHYHDLKSPYLLCLALMAIGLLIELFLTKSEFVTWRSPKVS